MDVCLLGPLLTAFVLYVFRDSRQEIPPIPVKKNARCLI